MKTIKKSIVLLTISTILVCLGVLLTGCGDPATGDAKGFISGCGWAKCPVLPNERAIFGIRMGKKAGFAQRGVASGRRWDAGNSLLPEDVLRMMR